MSYICDRCGKGKLAGHWVSHAKNRTPRMASPNLHRVSLGKGRPSLRLCTECLRTIRLSQKNLTSP